MTAPNSNSRKKRESRNDGNAETAEDGLAHCLRIVSAQAAVDLDRERPVRPLKNSHRLPVASRVFTMHSCSARSAGNCGAGRFFQIIRRRDGDAPDHADTLGNQSRIIDLTHTDGDIDALFDEVE